MLKRRGPRFHFDPRSHLSHPSRHTRRYTPLSSRFMTWRFLAPLHPLTHPSAPLSASTFFSSFFFLFLFETLSTELATIPPFFPPLARNYVLPFFRDAVRNASVSLDDLKFPSLANSCPRSTRGNLNRTGQTVSPL